MSLLRDKAALKYALERCRVAELTENDLLVMLDDLNATVQCDDSGRWYVTVRGGRHPYKLGIYDTELIAVAEAALELVRRKSDGSH